MESLITITDSGKMEVFKQMDGVVAQVLGSDLQGKFEKAYLVSTAIQKLREGLTDEYMRPIMAMQGSKLGFKTDKDKEGGYLMNVVKDCVIDATLIGLSVAGNEFNIIGGNMYPTKEGMKALLRKIDGLVYDITFQLPRMSETSAAVTAVVNWDFKGGKGQKELQIPIKVNKFMGVDGVIGKATRKASYWLYNHITGNDFGEGDVMDIEHVQVSTTTKSPEEAEMERFRNALEKCSMLTEVVELEKQLAPEFAEMVWMETENKKANIEQSNK